MDIHEQFASDLLDLGTAWKSAGSPAEKFVISVAAFLRALQWAAETAPAPASKAAAEFHATVADDLKAAQAGRNVPANPSPLAPTTMARSQLVTSPSPEQPVDKPMTADERFADRMAKVESNVLSGREYEIIAKDRTAKAMAVSADEGLDAPKTYAAFKKEVEIELASRHGVKPADRPLTADESAAARMAKVSATVAVYDRLTPYQQQQIDVMRHEETTRRTERHVLAQIHGRNFDGHSFG